MPKSSTHLIPSIEFKRIELENLLQKNVFDSIINIKKSLAAPVINMIQSPVVFNGGNAFYSGFFDSSRFYSYPNYINYGDVNSHWTIAGIPLQMHYTAGNWSGSNMGNFSFQFDRQGYLDNLKKSLISKVDPKTFLNAIPNPLELLKNNAELLLKKELNQINDKYKNLLSNHISELGNLQELFTKDILSLRQTLLQDHVIQSLPEQQNLLENLQAKINNGEFVDTTQYNNVRDFISQVEGTKKIIEIVQKHKNNWQSSGLLSKLKEWEVFKAAGLDNVMNDPSMITKVAKQQLNLNNLQRIFLNLNKLNLGQNTVSVSSLSFQNFLNNGAVTEYVKDGKAALFVLGKSMEGASILDMPFSDHAFSNTIAKGLQLNKKTSSGGLSYAVTGFEQGVNAIGTMAGMNSIRRSIVTTIGKEFNFGKYTVVSTEISRSLANYNNGSSNNEDANSFLKLFSTDNFASNTSFNIRYKDEFPASDLNYQVYIKKTAIGYDNPGNPFLNSGSQEASFTLRKNFLKKKLLVSLRSDIKEFNYSERAGNKWRNFYSVVDIKWKYKKGQFFSLRYLPNRMLRISDQVKEVTTLFDHLSFDGNLNKKLGQFYYNNYFSLIYQKNSYRFNGINNGNTSVGFNSNQNFNLNKLNLFWNTQLNHSSNNTQLVYFNSSFNSEIGSGFVLFNKINSTTSLSYNSIYHWYRQIGIRQNISLNINERFDFNFFIDARKNLKLYQPLLFGLLRGEVSINYQLK